MGKLKRRTTEPKQENKNVIRLVSNKTTVKKLDKETKEITDKITKLKRRIKTETEENKETVSDKVQKEIQYRETQVVKAFQDIGKRKGRPTRLTEQLMQNMEVLARIGLSEESICNAVKLHPSLLTRWKNKNPEFSSRLNTARETGKAILVNSIFGHGLKNWTAHAWLLERQYRHEFGQNQKVELTGKDSGPLVFKVVYEEKKEVTSKNDSITGKDNPKQIKNK